jgi:hypothetical protein
MTAGDRVKLRSDLAKMWTEKSRSGRKGGPRKVDWTRRCGEVLAVNQKQVTIKWDDRKSPDHWPRTAIVVIES